jgi:hypothetical protein
MAMETSTKEAIINKQNKWGQSNINLVNLRVERPRGASSYWGTKNRSAPLGLSTLRLEINVALTSFIFVAGHQLNNLYKRSGWQAQGLSLVGFTVGASE